MAIQVIDEARWIAAAKEGGTMYDIENAFLWSSAEEWPCPGAEPNDVYNGWGVLARNNTPSHTPIPPHIREYIAIMYVDWKLNA